MTIHLVPFGKCLPSKVMPEPNDMALSVSCDTKAAITWWDQTKLRKWQTAMRQWSTDEQWMRRWVNRWVHRWVGGFIHPCIHPLKNGWVCEGLGGWWIDWSMKGWVVGGWDWVGWIGWINGWTGEWMDGGKWTSRLTGLDWCMETRYPWLVNPTHRTHWRLLTTQITETLSV